jgi:hypothetical protein
MLHEEKHVTFELESLWNSKILNEHIPVEN